MDAADPLAAQGIPCAFDSYEVLRGDVALRADRWVRVESGIPGKGDRIRGIEPAGTGPLLLDKLGQAGRR